MISAKDYKPRMFPIKGDTADAEIDRAQNIAPTPTLNRDKVEEIGRDGRVGYLKKSPSVPYRLTQLEYGSIEFFQKLINDDVLGNVGQTGIAIKDFKTSYFDLVGYLTDNDGTYVGTIHYPSLRCAGFGITVGEPQGIIERSFDLIGESAIQWQGDNKYFIYNKHTCVSDVDNVIDLSGKAPAEDPDNTGVYMFRVVRVTALGVTTELTRTTDYTYSSITKELTIVSVTTGDIIKSYYTSAIAPDTQFTANDSDPSAINGESVSIYLYIPASGKPSASDYVYRLQNVGIDVRFTREDLRELGSKDVKQRGITDTVVTVTLGRILEDFTVEEILRGVSSGYGKIDIEKLTDSATLLVKIFSDNTKSVFKYGYKITGLSPTDLGTTIAINEHVKKDATLESEDLLISADSTVIGI